MHQMIEFFPYVQYDVCEYIMLYTHGNRIGLSKYGMAGREGCWWGELYGFGWGSTSGWKCDIDLSYWCRTRGGVWKGESIPWLNHYDQNIRIPVQDRMRRAFNAIKFIGQPPSLLFSVYSSSVDTTMNALMHPTDINNSSFINFISFRRKYLYSHFSQKLSLTFHSISPPPFCLRFIYSQSSGHRHQHKQLAERVWCAHLALHSSGSGGYIKNHDRIFIFSQFA